MLVQRWYDFVVRPDVENVSDVFGRLGSRSRHLDVGSKEACDAVGQGPGNVAAGVTSEF